jgi:hypothetical protein
LNIEIFKIAEPNDIEKFRKREKFKILQEKEEREREKKDKK